MELINLGLGGSALLDPFTARAMRDTPADLISVKIGINLVNADVMRLRAFAPAVHGFLDTIREGHPDTPLLVVSPILCPIHEDTPGPSAPDFSGLAEGRLRFTAMGDPAERAAGKLTLNVIRDELSRLVTQRSADDPHLYYVDGRSLYGEKDLAELPLPDALHPDAATHRRMGKRFMRPCLYRRRTVCRGQRLSAAPPRGVPEKQEEFTAARWQDPAMNTDPLMARARLLWESLAGVPVSFASAAWSDGGHGPRVGPGTAGMGGHRAPGRRGHRHRAHGRRGARRPPCPGRCPHPVVHRSRCGRRGVAGRRGARARHPRLSVRSATSPRHDREASRSTVCPQAMEIFSGCSLR